ncbi:hypothetical protein PTTG_26646 [Puccinia triticina 1-1 BBBD Race 1]|uniref:Uncharacterized protein n=1 Tax=Puccinia triticina (isolate 1-1 / race 1 (BBBD)) TaxID=630390 RepID=A0A180GTA6_PUCT1|nr:hypothetical protein PTTG_26646 [Puccinia triticina 1-1 BBBD Race 1]
MVNLLDREFIHHYTAGVLPGPRVCGDDGITGSVKSTWISLLPPSSPPSRGKCVETTGFPVVSTRLGFPRHSDGENDEDSTAAPGIPVKNCPHLSGDHNGLPGEYTSLCLSRTHRRPRSATSSPSSSPPPTPSSSLCYLQALLTAQPPKTKAAQSKIAISPSLTDRTTGLGSFSSQPTGNASDHDYRISDSAAGLRTQYLITNLAPATNYSAWLFQPGPVVNNVPTGRLWPYISFRTKSTKNCSLLHGLPFCPSVAYAVPASPSLSTSAVVAQYNRSVSGHLANFRTVVSTYPCNNDTSGRYSFVTGCGDCLRAYTDWACAVALPRCVDPPAASPEAPGTPTQVVFARPDPAHRYASAEQNWLSKVCLQQAPQLVGWARIKDYVDHKMARMAELDADWPAALVRYWNVLRRRILSGAGDADNDELYLTKFRALYPAMLRGRAQEAPGDEDEDGAADGF